MTATTKEFETLHSCENLAEKLQTLTRREAEVLEYLVNGLSNEQIAKELFRSAKTIDKHCQNIYAKTGIQFLPVRYVNDSVDFWGVGFAACVGAVFVGFIHQDFLDVTTLLWNGKLRPVIDRVMPLNRGKEAYSILERGEQFGKIVLTP